MLIANCGKANRDRQKSYRKKMINLIALLLLSTWVIFKGVKVARQRKWAIYYPIGVTTLGKKAVINGVIYASLGLLLFFFALYKIITS